MLALIFALACAESTDDSGAPADGGSSSGEAVLVDTWWDVWMGDLNRDHAGGTECVMFTSGGEVLERGSSGADEVVIASGLAITWGSGRYAWTDHEDDLARLDATHADDGSAWVLDVDASDAYWDQSTERFAYDAQGFAADLLPCTE